MPKYFGVTLDRLLTYRLQFESLRKKLTPRVALLRRLSGSGRGTGATTLRTVTLSLVHSTAEYCAPVWCRSAHTRLIDLAINDALRIVTGCLHPTRVDNLPILASIQPAEFSRNGATLSLARRAMDPGHLPHSALTCPSSANARCLKSRHPFVPTAQQLINLLTTTTYVWRSGRITNGMRSGRTILQNSALLSPTPAPTPEWPSQEQRGSGLTATTPVSDASAPALKNGDRLLCRLWVWCKRTNRRPCCPPISNPSTSPSDCTASWFWTMWQSNGCWTPAPRSNAA